MRGRTARGLVAGTLCAAATLGTPMMAFADSTTSTTIATISSPAPSQWESSESAFVSKRHAVHLSYQMTVDAARAAFNFAIGHSKNPQARKNARKVLLNSLAAADAAQAAALAALGTGPAATGELDQGEYQLELSAINLDYADTVNAARSTYQAEIAAATSSAQLVTARATMKLDIAEATMSRSTALAALGSAPPRKSGSSPTTTNPPRRDN